MPKQRVVITGLGTITPLGLTVDRRITWTSSVLTVLLSVLNTPLPPPGWQWTQPGWT